MHLAEHIYGLHGKPGLTLWLQNRERSRDGKLQLVEGLEGLLSSLAGERWQHVFVCVDLFYLFCFSQTPLNTKLYFNRHYWQTYST